MSPPLNLNRDYAIVWIDTDHQPESFIDRFEIQQRAQTAAARHLLATGEGTPGRDWKHPFLRLLHPFGIHEWVKVLVYIPPTDRIMDPGRGRVVCRNCPN